LFFRRPLLKIFLPTPLSVSISSVARVPCAGGEGD